MTQERREKDRPWVMRTYSGHSTARASNELYRTNLARGQTGLSIAFGDFRRGYLVVDRAGVRVLRGVQVATAHDDG